MYCSSCGAEIDDGKVYCSECGEPTTDPPTASADGDDGDGLDDRDADRGGGDDRDDDGGRDRFAHLTGDYYYDREAYPAWQWLVVAGLCIGLPPVGIFFLVWMGVGTLTADPEPDDDEPDGDEVEDAGWV